MLVSFCRYLVPSVVIASIFNLSVLVCLKAVSTFELVNGDGLGIGSVGAIFREKIYMPKKKVIGFTTFF